MNINRSKLALRKQSIRTLTADELSMAHGGKGNGTKGTGTARRNRHGQRHRHRHAPHQVVRWAATPVVAGHARPDRPITDFRCGAVGVWDLPGG